MQTMFGDVLGSQTSYFGFSNTLPWICFSSDFFILDFSKRQRKGLRRDDLLHLSKSKLPGCLSDSPCFVDRICLFWSVLCCFFLGWLTSNRSFRVA